ncbi:MAG: M14 family metallopeptidase [Roseiflexaceae bacterium]
MRFLPSLHRLSALLVLVLLVALLPGAGAASPAAQTLPMARYRITGAATRQQRSALAAAGVAIDAVGPGWVEVTATPQDLRRIAALGFVAHPLPADFPLPDAAYHNYAETVDEIRAVAATHPTIIQLFSIGHSYEGRELWAAKISDNVALDEDEPEALFVGHYHAREHLTVEMILYILHMLADEYSVPGHEQITQLVDSREIFLIFDLNPDGGEYDIIGDAYHFWRKNRQPNADGSTGTDPNRNHSYRWGGLGSSDVPSSDVYHGPTPASAPEVAAIESFVNSRVVGGAQQISVAITFHTYGELVLWPYGYTDDDLPEDMRPDDHAVLVVMGQAMAATNGYTPQQSSDLYTTSGDFTDWAYGVHRIFAYTFEMYPTDSSSFGFYPPGSAIAAQTARNRAAVLYLLTQAGCPYDVIGAAAAYCTSGRINAPTRMWMPIISI